MVTPKMDELLNRVNQKRDEIYAWLEDLEHTLELPLYSSVDIRDAGFKVATVDTNLFPAGFNNLCEHGIEDSVIEIRKAVLDRVSDCKEILIIAEEHTRNTWYLENVRILQNIIKEAGFKVYVASFLDVQPEFCQDMNFIELETATGNPLRVYCMKKIVKKIESGEMKLDLIIMNNDLTSGIPDILRDSKIPIYPSINAGWHSRLKSYHFRHTSDLMQDFAKILDVDPWLFSCLDEVVDEVDINSEADRERLKEAAERLFEKITAKYQEHGINEKPFIFMKADAGTYGMGVMAFESPEEILDLNKRGRKKLKKGKGAKDIYRFLLQEGVPTRFRFEDQPGEVCIYQIDNKLVGGFYRVHADKSDRDNLNSKGMGFQKMCPHLDKYGHCGSPTEANIFDLYRIVARIAGIAAHREIAHLEAKVNV